MWQPAFNYNTAFLLYLAGFVGFRLVFLNNSIIVYRKPLLIRKGDYSEWYKIKNTMVHVLKELTRSCCMDICTAISCAILIAPLSGHVDKISDKLKLDCNKRKALLPGLLFIIDHWPRSPK